MAEFLVSKNINQNLAIAASALALAGTVEQTAPAFAETQTPPQVFAEHHPVFVYRVPKPIILPWILRRIGGCESNGSPTAPIDYRAQNPLSTASGGFQFLDKTWANFRGYSRAKYAPPRIQKIKAIRTLHSSGTAPWYSSESCWG
jgi:hypothetical protein